MICDCIMLIRTFIFPLNGDEHILSRCSVFKIILENNRCEIDESEKNCINKCNNMQKYRRKVNNIRQNMRLF